MAFEDYKSKPSVNIVYTGEGKGKTSASLGLMVRALGTGWNVAYIQFIKVWPVGEHNFITTIQESYKNKLYFYKGGKGFYDAGDLSAKNVSELDHRKAAQETLSIAVKTANTGKYNLVICDEINNAVHDGLLKTSDLKNILTKHHENTSICLTGRDFPDSLLKYTDIATNMTKLKHHFDDKFLANKGIDY